MISVDIFALPVNTKNIAIKTLSSDKTCEKRVDTRLINQRVPVTSLTLLLKSAGKCNAQK